MDMSKLKTLTGLTVEQIREKLDASLPPEAYTKIGGTKLDLTDIDPNWMRRAYNGIFGLCGLGWGTSYETADLVHELKGERENPAISIKKMILWYILVDDQGKEIRCEVPATGSNTSQQGNIGFAMKGALTNAMGNAASQMGWQESVYLGYRSHNDTKGSAPKATKKASEKPPFPPADQTKTDDKPKDEKPPFPPANPATGVPPVEKTGSTSTTPEPSTAEQVKADIEKITALCKGLGLKTRGDHFAKMAEITGHPVKSWVDMTNAGERAKVIECLIRTVPAGEKKPTLRFFLCSCGEVATVHVPEMCRKCKAAPDTQTEFPTLAAARLAGIEAAKKAANPGSLGRTQKLTAIFELTGRFGCKTPSDACEEVSQILGRAIKASADLTDAELDKVLKELTELVAGLGL